MVGKVLVAGVGMIPFAKPGQSEDWDLMAEKAIRSALTDAGIDVSMVQSAYAGYAFGDTTSGQSAFYRVGTTGIPFVNVNNACATGATALYLARQLIALGGADCVLAFGFEQMRPGAISSPYSDRKPPMEKFSTLQNDVQGIDAMAPPAAQMFGGAGIEYQSKYGTKSEVFGKIAVKARLHAANNPLAIFREPISLEEVMSSKHLYGPITRLQSCPPTCGAAAAVLVSPEFARKHGLSAEVEIKAQAMSTDFSSTFDERSMLKMVGFDMAKAAAQQVYEEAGVGPEDIQVVELHDCFTTNELFTYEALGLCPNGGGEKFIEDGDNTYGGKFVVNPSGGLLSKGHPLGATGFAQCYELVHQLRQTAEKRQVDGVKYALAHNLGLGGACVVTLLGHA